MTKAILFDLDGVIIKDPIFSTVYAAEFGITPEDMFPFFTKEFQKCLIGQADLKTILQPHLKNWKWTKSVDELIEYWMTHHAEIDQAVLQKVSELRASGIPCYLVTNQEKNRAKYIWNDLGMHTVFTGKFISCELGLKKPQSEYYWHILKELQISDPSEALLIDDSKNFINGAAAIGINTIHFTGLEQLNTALKPFLS